MQVEIGSTINGFIILEDYGNDEKKVWRVKVVCKACQIPFTTSFYSLKRIKGCGCNRPRQLKPLPEFINGFRIIKCHGYDSQRGVRWATVECKICKKEYEVDPNKLKYRKHCGCIRLGVVASKYVKEYPGMVQSYKHMQQRCYNKKNKDFHNYGARGISICEDWLKDRNNFYSWSLSNGYVSGLTIDRIDNDKGYEPDNCRWVTMSEQGKNTRRCWSYRLKKNDH